MASQQTVPAKIGACLAKSLIGLFSGLVTYLAVGRGQSSCLAIVQPLFLALM